MEKHLVHDIAINVNKKQFYDIKNHSKSHIAIKNLRLFIPKGQFCAIIGPSGCGKTTLLNLISGLDKNLDGKIQFGSNKNINNIKLAYMFQTPRLLPWLNVIENVEVVLNKDQKQKDKSINILSLMGLKKFINYYPNKLSGGMQRRVALARSFATEPELFILDEPFVSLDEPVANLLRKMLLNLWTKQPTTIIFVTHDINEAIFLADRIIFLSKAPAKILKDIKIKHKKPRNFQAHEIEKIKKEIIKKNKSILKGEL